MKKLVTFITFVLIAMSVSAQSTKTFTTVKELPITSIKNQYRSGTCWDYGRLGYLESEILRKTVPNREIPGCKMTICQSEGVCYGICITH